MDKTDPGRNARQRTISRGIIRRVKSLPNTNILRADSCTLVQENASPPTSNFPIDTTIESEYDAGQPVVDHTPVGPFESSSSVAITPEASFDVNLYQQKKTLAQGMMDLALISANANQMRYVLQFQDESFYTPAMCMITMSLVLQVAVGVGLIWNSRYNVKKQTQTRQANQTNNWTVIGIFLVTILNVFISSFGVSSSDSLETEDETSENGDYDTSMSTPQ